MNIRDEVRKYFISKALQTFPLSVYKPLLSLHIFLAGMILSTKSSDCLVFVYLTYNIIILLWKNLTCVSLLFLLMMHFVWPKLYYNCARIHCWAFFYTKAIYILYLQKLKIQVERTDIVGRKYDKWHFQKKFSSPESKRN